MSDITAAVLGITTTVIIFNPNAPLTDLPDPSGGGNPVAVTQLEPSRWMLVSLKVPSRRPPLPVLHVRGGPDIRGVHVGQLDGPATPVV